jgi:Ca-activated chloride channel family protein
MNRKTATIVCGAVGLAAAAALYGARATGSVSRPPVPPPEPPSAGGTCGAAPARASVPFTQGSMTAALSAGRALQGGDGEIFASFDLAALAVPAERRPPMSVAIVIDHSGSMQGEKIEKAREAARGLVERLGAGDRAALVQYDDTAEVLVPSIAVDERGKSRLEAAIASVQDAGGTNLHDGLALGRDEILRNLTPGTVNRVILLSDGNANVGVTDIPSLSRVASDASERGVRISTIGLGLDYNEDLMEQVADHGRGQYYYVRDAATLDAVFAGELRAIQGTVATATELRLEPACAGVEIAEVYGYPTRRDGAATIVPLADLAGGDKRKIVARLKVPTAQLGAAKVLSATLSFAPAAGGARQSAVATIGVEITADRLAVDQSIDPDVAGKLAQIESSRTMRQAAEAYQAGDQKAAMRILSIGRAKVAAKAKWAPAEARKVEEQLDGLGAGFAATPATSHDAPAMVKAGKKMAAEAAK